MKTVEFRALDNKGNDIVIGSLSWDGNNWQSDGEDWINELSREVGNKEPEDFLANLKYRFMSPYLRASDPK